MLTSFNRCPSKKHGCGGKELCRSWGRWFRCLSQHWRLVRECNEWETNIEIPPADGEDSNSPSDEFDGWDFYVPDYSQDLEPVELTEEQRDELDHNHFVSTAQDVALVKLLDIIQKQGCHLSAFNETLDWAECCRLVYWWSAFGILVSWYLQGEDYQQG